VFFIVLHQTVYLDQQFPPGSCKSPQTIGGLTFVVTTSSESRLIISKAEGTSSGTGTSSSILTYQSPTLACSSIMLEEIGSAAECQSFANNNGLTWKGSLTNDANWIDGCFQWYGTPGDPVGSSTNVYWNNRNGATSGNLGGHKICAGVDGGWSEDISVVCNVPGARQIFCVSAATDNGSLGYRWVLSVC
jgi:hypothetical protein